MSWFFSQFGPLLVSLGVALVPPFLAWLTVVVKQQFEKMPTAQRNTLTSIVSTCVNAVEQSSPNMPGTVKKQLAESFIEAQLAHYGLKVPSSVVDANVEEAVLLLNMAQNKAIKVAVPAAHGTISPSDLTGNKG